MPILLLLVSLTAGYFSADTEVFVVPHTHTDTGWLEDPDVRFMQEYYERIVCFILDSVVSAMENEENRRFVWAETYYLQRWYSATTAASRSVLKELIRSGRLELVGGGLVQHDEALPSLDMLIRQLERGLDFLSKEFGVTQLPVAWQIDPFGHSGLSPALFRQFGFRYFVGNRINQSLKESLQYTRSLEFIWEGSALGPQSAILTHILPESYGYPSSLHPFIDSSCWHHSSWYTLISPEQLFALILKHQRYFRHNKLMILYGDDFTYDIASFTKDLFQKTESLFEEMRWKYGVNVHWGTPSAYFASLSSTAFPTFLGDFFPYMSFQGSQPRYWTGFYSLLPTFKRTIYDTAQVLRLADIWGVASGEEKVQDEGLCLSLHHDAITGTCRPHVVNYYCKALDKVRTAALSSLSQSFSRLLKPERTDKVANTTSFILCNPLNWPLDDLLSVQSPTAKVEIRDPYGGPVAAQSYFSQATGLYEVFFRVRMPGLSMGVYTMRRSEESAVPSTRKKAWNLVGKDFTVSLSSIGLLDSLSHNHTVHLHSQHFLSSNSYLGGAYTLSPSSPSPISLHLLYMDIWTGPLFSVLEVKWGRGDCSKLLSQRILVPKQALGWVLWEVWVSAADGEEVFMAFGPSALPSLWTFDAVTWRERRYREVEKAEEMGRNFYPISGAVQFGADLVVIPTSPLGAGLYTGLYCLHLHRSLTVDDGWGLVYAVKDSSEAYHRLKVTLKDQRFTQTYWEAKTALGLFAVKEDLSLALEPVRLREEREWSAQLPAVWLRLNTTQVYLSSLATNGKSLITRFLIFANITRETLWPGVALGPDLLLSKQKGTAELPYLSTNVSAFPFHQARTHSVGAELRTFRAVALQGLSEEVGWPEGGWQEGEREDWSTAEAWVQETESQWVWWGVGLATVCGLGLWRLLRATHLA